MKKLEQLKDCLLKTRDNLHNQGIEYKGDGDLRAAKIFEMEYQKCIEDIFTDNLWWEVTHFWDIFDGMLEGLNDTEVIDEIINHVEPSFLEEGFNSLPLEVTVKLSDLDYVKGHDDLDEVISDYLSDNYGFCHFGFEYDVDGDNVNIYEIDWDTDNEYEDCRIQQLKDVYDIEPNDLTPEEIEELRNSGVLDESVLNENTSNFGSMEELPLLVFDDYEANYEYALERAEEEYNSLDDDEEIDYDEFIEDYIEEHMKEFERFNCSLVEEDIESLKDDLDNFNDELHDLADELIYETDSDESQSRGWALKDLEFILESGYYEGYQIYTEHWHPEDLDKEDIEKIKNFLYQMKEKYGLTELVVGGRFSSGETVYSIKEGKESNIETVYDYFNFDNKKEVAAEVGVDNDPDLWAYALVNSDEEGEPLITELDGDTLIDLSKFVLNGGSQYSKNGKSIEVEFAGPGNWDEIYVEIAKRILDGKLRDKFYLNKKSIEEEKHVADVHISPKGFNIKKVASNEPVEWEVIWHSISKDETMFKSFTTKEEADTFRTELESDEDVVKGSIIGPDPWWEDEDGELIDYEPTTMSESKEHKKLKEGYIGQTLEDFLDDCNNKDEITYHIYNVDGDGSLVFEGEYDDIPAEVLNSSFNDFECSELIVNVGEDESNLGGYYETLDSFLDDINDCDSIHVWSNDEEDEIFEGEKDDIPGEITELGFNSFDASEELHINVEMDEDDIAQMHGYEDRDDEVFDDYDEYEDDPEEDEFDESLKESKRNETFIYLFPELTTEDIEELKNYDLQFLGKNIFEDEENWVVKGLKKNLSKYCKDYLGYTMHPDYLYAEDEFAGDIVEESLKEDLDVDRKKALKKALTQLKKPGVEAVIIGYSQGGKKTYLEKPLPKKSMEELRDFEKGFRRGKQGTKVVVDAVYKRQLDDIKSTLNIKESKQNSLPKEVLSIELEDDDTKEGGISFIGETVKDFIESIDIQINTIEELNDALEECGIKPISLNIKESKTKRKKSRKDFKIHVNKNAGDPVKNAQAFNHAMGSDTEEGVSLGESNETKTSLSKKALDLIKHKMYNK